MTPQTTAQNLLIWCAAFALAVLLSFLSGIATHWPDGGSIDWRAVALDVIQTILTTAPLVAAGFGLPRIGKEAIAVLVSGVGKGPAQAALEAEAERQIAGAPMAPDQVAQIVSAVKAEMMATPADPLPPKPRYGPAPQPESVPDHIISLIDRDERRRDAGS